MLSLAFSLFTLGEEGNHQRHKKSNAADQRLR